ncbi:N-6 DNA methylase [Nocardioides sp. TF02-7]|uniref:HsdM family class I SAM-dependent methyltransferase n=1 Tax=Nocardioides sp. TF02-7 TaxID=2917724 RepID=UPI001F05A48A|nr:N-6 DNA methylase [Nocardioides sp. TF02-7]UMG92687.1 SAM-dependent methyltransferase [Nocardioides sp. TF02-7]
MGERQRVEALAVAYEQRLAEQREGRRERGAFYTPPDLVSWVLDRALGPGVARVLDPACGTGHFLVAAARRLGARSVHGSDLDPEAVAIARARLLAEDPTLTPDEVAQQVRVADGLTAWDGEQFDAVVGNPPFLGQLRRRTAGRSDARPAAYTDTSAVFLQRALELVRPGGTVALVQPLSVLAARDAGPVRRAVAERGAVTDLWCSPRPVFAGTSVLTCVPVVRVGDPGATDPDGWGRLAAPSYGIPPVRLRTGDGAVGDLAVCTADFRDQYYGLVPHVRDGGLDGSGAPLVTSGLIEPAGCEWGRRPTRFARRRLDEPVVDLAGLRAGPLASWADARLVPKLLVAGQGRVVEAVVDERGAWLPSVPVVSVVPSDPADLWRLLAVLLAPPLVADAAARYLGAGLTPGSVKLSARQLAALPLPADPDAWAEGALLAERAQRDRDPSALAATARVMTRAYGGDEEVTAWWLERAGVE